MDKAKKDIKGILNKPLYNDLSVIIMDLIGDDIDINTHKKGKYICQTYCGCLNCLLCGFNILKCKNCLPLLESHQLLCTRYQRTSLPINRKIDYESDREREKRLEYYTCEYQSKSNCCNCYNCSRYIIYTNSLINQMHCMCPKCVICGEPLKDKKKGKFEHYHTRDYHYYRCIYCEKKIRENNDKENVSYNLKA